MAYTLNQTIGTVLAELPDSTIDQTSTSLTLIGKNTAQYGQYINGNFVKLLENFASSFEPASPLVGQLWYDTSVGKLKVFDGSIFKDVAAPVVSGFEPSNLQAGDLWIDNVENQIYFYNGTNTVLVGPIYKDSQGISGFTVDSIVDTTNVTRVVLSLWVAGTLLGIISKETTPFTPKVPISNFNGLIKPGYNSSTLVQRFYATAISSDYILNNAGQRKTTNNFLKTNDASTTVGTVSIQNDRPLILGQNQYIDFKIDTSKFQILSNVSNQNIHFNIQNSIGNQDAISLIGLTNRVGIFKTSPESTLHVGGDLIVDDLMSISGSLRVKTLAMTLVVISQVGGIGTIDVSQGNYFSHVVTSPVEYEIVNTGTYFTRRFILQIQNGGNHTVTWPANITWPNGGAPALSTNGIDLIEFFLEDSVNFTWNGLVKTTNVPIN